MRQPLVLVHVANGSLATSTTVAVDYSSTVTDEISKKIYFVATGGAVAVILLMAFLIALYYILSRRRRDEDLEPAVTEKKSPNSHYTTYTAVGNGHGGHHPTFYSRVETGSVSSGYTSCSAPSVGRGGGLVSRRLREPRHILADLHVLRQRVTLGDAIMDGTFGRVVRGTLSSTNGQSSQPVLVKTIIDSEHRADQIVVLQQDACLLAGLEHPSLAPPIAVCVMDGARPMVMYAMPAVGNLKLALQQSRQPPATQLTTPQLVLLCMHILRGLQHLHRHKIVHKDVAARNCYLDCGLNARLADAALSRDLFSTDYQCLGDNENRPVRWLSIEALVERKYSPASDCWAFGVTLWEVITRGQTPYEDLDPFEMPTYLRSGARMPQPANCPDKLFQLMATTWLARPEGRPKISKLLHSLTDFYQQMVNYV